MASQFALWAMSVDTTRNSGSGSGGNNIFYAITANGKTLPDPDEVMKIAMPTESIFEVNSIQLLHGEIDMAADDNNEGHPLTQMGRSFISGAKFYEKS